AVPCLPHQRLAAEVGDAIEQRLAGLDVGNDRRTGMFVQHRSGEQHHQLVAPDDPPLAINRTNTVAVAVEGDAEIEAVGEHELLEVREVLFNGWVRMMVGEAAVDLREDREVLARKSLDQLFDRRASRAIARVPADAEAAPLEILDQAIDV